MLSNFIDIKVRCSNFLLLSWCYPISILYYVCKELVVWNVPNLKDT